MRDMIESPKNTTPPPEVASEKSAGFKTLLAVQSEKKSQKEEKKTDAGIAGASCEKKVEVVSDEGVVKKIRVHCTCGEMTEIDCQYSE